MTMTKSVTKAIILMACATAAFAYNNQAPDLPNQGQNGWVDVIVQFSHAPSNSDLQLLQQYQGNSQGGNVNTNWGQQGWAQNGWAQNLGTIKAIHLKMPPGAVQQLSQVSSVSYVSPVRTVKRALDVVSATVNANIAWQFGFDGRGVGVAVIDSGITQTDDLMDSKGINSRIVYSETFIDGATDTTDQYGHGTHVAGIVGANGHDSTGRIYDRTFKGVAPQVNLINLKVLDATGTGQESDVIEAIQRAIQLKNTYNIRVINLSLGRPVYESYKLDPLCQAVEAAWQAGIVVVTAAGNGGRDNSMGEHGYGTILSPGNDPYVITVGATKTNGTPYRWDDSVASYSSKGPTLIDHIVKPDLVAPGNLVVSLLSPGSTIGIQYPSTLIPYTYYEDIWSPGISRYYYRLSGTSMATPVVAGAAALLIEQNPSLTPDQVKARLMKTASKTLSLHSVNYDSNTFQMYKVQADIFTVGAGYLDIAAALKNTDLVTLPAASPTAVYNAKSNKVTIVNSLSLDWLFDVVWGETTVWGSAVFTGADLGLFDVVWGEDDLLNFDVVWGETVAGIQSVQSMSENSSDQ